MNKVWECRLETVGMVSDAVLEVYKDEADFAFKYIVGDRTVNSRMIKSVNDLNVYKRLIPDGKYRELKDIMDGQNTAN